MPWGISNTSIEYGDLVIIFRVNVRRTLSIHDVHSLVLSMITWYNVGLRMEDQWFNHHDRCVHCTHHQFIFSLKVDWPNFLIGWVVTHQLFVITISQDEINWLYLYLIGWYRWEYGYLQALVFNYRDLDLVIWNFSLIFQNHQNASGCYIMRMHQFQFQQALCLREKQNRELRLMNVLFR